MKQIITLTAGSRCGKDTFANILKEELQIRDKKVLILSFATELKQAVAEMLSISVDDLEEYKNNNKYVTIKVGAKENIITTREFIILYSAATRKNIGNEVFLDNTINIIYDSDVDIVIIPDLRFKIEEDKVATAFDNYYSFKIISDLPECSADKIEYETDSLIVDEIIENKIDDLDHFRKEAVRLIDMYMV